MNLYNKIFIIVAIIYLLAVPLNSKLAVYQYTQDNGLLGMYVNNITQDNKGILWCSTNEGVSKYDGYKWYNDFFNSSKIQNNINEIFYDELNRFWGIDVSGNSVKFVDLLKPYNSLPKFNINENIRQNEYKFHLNNTNNLITAAFTNKNKLWVYTNYKWNYYDLSKYYIDNIYSIYSLKNKVLIGTNKGIYKFENYKITPFAKDIIQSNTHIYSIVPEKNNENKLWLLTNKYVAFYNSNRIFIYKKFDKDIIKDPLNKYYLVPNYNNVIIYGNSSFINLFSNSSSDEIALNRSINISNDYYNSIFIDRENILWISTTNGIYKIPSISFSNYSESEGLLENNVTSILEISKNNYIFGHPTGFTFLEVNNIASLKKLENKSGFVHKIVKNNKGEIYAAVGGLGIANINFKSKSISYIAPSSLGVYQVNSIAIDKNQNIIYSDNKNVFKYSNGKYLKIFNDSNSSIRDIFISKSNRIIVTTNNNGIYYQNNNGGFTQALTYDNKGNNTYSFYEDRNGIPWVGTNNGMYYLSDKYLIRSLKYNKYLINEKVFAIINSPDGAHWLGTSKGIMYSNDNENLLKSYSKGSGIISIDINKSALIYDQNNNLFVGTTKGLSKFKSSLENKNNIKPIIFINNFKVNDQDYPFNEELFLKNSQNNLDFEISVPSFYYENNNKIYYKLIPTFHEFEEIDYQNLNKIVFRNLNPGKYKLLIKAKNSYGIYSDDLIIDNITIMSPFYKRFNFVLLSILVILFILFLITKYIINSLNKKRLEDEVHKRTKELEISNSRYMRLFYDNNAMMMIIDPDSLEVKEANPSAVNYFSKLGIKFEKGDSLLKAGGPAHFTRKDLINLMQSVKEIEFTFKFNINDNIITRNFAAYITKIIEFEKELLYVIFNDITAQKIAENKIKQLNENLELTVQNRTKELENALEILQSEIVKRMETEENLKKAKEDLESSLEREKELNKLKSQFILMISHEYRTPLTVIYSSTEIIYEFIKLQQFEATEKYITRIQNSVEMLIQLMDDSLKIGDDSLFRVNNEKFTLNEFLSVCVNDFNLKYKNSHNIKFISNYEDIPLIQDRNALKQILNNIVDNAYKFSEKGTDIILNVENDEKYVFITVQDFGIGMDNYTKEKIFDLFYKSDSTIGLYSGTGLGMPLAKKYSTIINGEITIESELKKGTSVTIKIPTNIENV